MRFCHHQDCIKELEEFIEKHCSGNTSAELTIKYLETLITKHFEICPTLTKKHLGYAEGFKGFEVYWFHTIIPNSGLSRTQHPKSYFYKNKDIICFLCLNSHINNYKDSKLRKLAQQRLEEILNVLKKVED